MLGPVIIMELKRCGENAAIVENGHTDERGARSVKKTSLHLKR